MISLDLNNFKRMNDTFGHLAGDDLLKQFATELRTVFRAYDVIGGRMPDWSGSAAG